MAKGFLLNNQDDLLIENGDLVIGDSEEQEIGLILRTNMGDWRGAPLTGFNLMRHMRSNVDAETFTRNLDTQLLQDGFADNRITLEADGKLIISANRNG
jgi:hypothetical protein